MSGNMGYMHFGDVTYSCVPVTLASGLPSRMYCISEAVASKKCDAHGGSSANQERSCTLDPISILSVDRDSKQ